MDLPEILRNPYGLIEYGESYNYRLEIGLQCSARGGFEFQVNVSRIQTVLKATVHIAMEAHSSLPLNFGSRQF